MNKEHMRGKEGEDRGSEREGRQGIKIANGSWRLPVDGAQRAAESQ